MRLFELHRDVDVSDVSGPGVVCRGVQSDDGLCVMRWLTDTSSVAIYANADDLIAIHGHGGATRLVWLDDAPIAELRKATALLAETCNVAANALLGFLPAGV